MSRINLDSVRGVCCDVKECLLDNKTLTAKALAVLCASAVCTKVLCNLHRRRELRSKVQGRKEKLTEELQRWGLTATQRKVDVSLQESILSMNVNQLKDALQKGSVAPEDVLATYQLKALKENEELNFITWPIREANNMLEQTKKEKEKGPLFCLPVSLKESVASAGIDCTLGFAYRIGQMETEDSVVVQVLKKQGAIPFMKTNVPQTLLSIDCYNPIHGATKNPYDLKRSPGGSSGGEGAALGSGASILGFGTDISGSLRIPAHFCGICALKPTVGRLSNKGVLGSTPGQHTVRGTGGPMARDVDGVVLLMKSLLVPYHWELDPEVPPLPFKDEVFSGKRKLKIGYYDSPGYIEVAPSCKRAVAMAVKAMKDLGHEVVLFKIPKFPEIMHYHLKSVVGDGGETVKRQLANDDIDPSISALIAGTKLPKFLRSLVARIAQWASNDPMMGSLMRGTQGCKDVTEMWEVAHIVGNYKKEFAEYWKELGLDAVIAPVVPFAAFRLGDYFNIWGSTLHTGLYNFVNFPTGVVPVTTVNADDIAALEMYPANTRFEKNVKELSQDSEGLPVGVQIAGLPWQEELVLRIMKDLETALKQK